MPLLAVKVEVMLPNLCPKFLTQNLVYGKQSWQPKILDIGLDALLLGLGANDSLERK